MAKLGDITVKFDSAGFLQALEAGFAAHVARLERDAAEEAQQFDRVRAEAQAAAGEQAQAQAALCPHGSKPTQCWQCTALRWQDEARSTVGDRDNVIAALRRNARAAAVLHVDDAREIVALRAQVAELREAKAAPAACRDGHAAFCYDLQTEIEARNDARKVASQWHATMCERDDEIKALKARDVAAQCEVYGITKQRDAAQANADTQAVRVAELNVTLNLRDNEIKHEIAARTELQKELEDKSAALAKHLQGRTSHAVLQRERDVAISALTNTNKQITQLKHELAVLRAAPCKDTADNATLRRERDEARAAVRARNATITEYQAEIQGLQREIALYREASEADRARRDMLAGCP